MATNENTTQVNGVNFKACGCGCGLPVTSKATYRPGHDARHAGQTARSAAEAALRSDNQERAVLEPGHYADLPSHHLRDKSAKAALKIVRNTISKANAKRLRETAKQQAAQAKALKASKPEQSGDERTGTYKIGRWVYPARMTRAGKVERNTKTNGSGNWVAVDEPGNAVWS